MKKIKKILLVALFGISVTLSSISFVNFNEMSIQQNSYILGLALLVLVGTIIVCYGMLKDESDSLEIYYEENLPPAYNEFISKEEEMITQKKQYLDRLYELQSRTEDPEYHDLLQNEIEQLRFELKGKT